MDRLDRIGIFRAKPIEFGIKESDKKDEQGNPLSLATAIRIKFQILEQLNNDNQWDSWNGYEVEVDGDFYFIDKEGKTLEDQLKRLIQSLGWDGDLDKLFDPDLQFNNCQITVKNEPYNGNDYFKATWINPFDYQPKQRYAVSSDKLSQLKTQFGAKLRAIASNITTNTPPPTAKPPVLNNEDDLPF